MTPGEWISVIVVGGATQGGISGFFWWLIKRLVDRKWAEFDGMKSKIEKASKDEIDAKFSALNRECQTKHQFTDKDIREIHKRLDQGSENFNAIDAKQHELDMSLLQRTNNIVVEMARTCATKQDLEKLATKDELKTAVATVNRGHK